MTAESKAAAKEFRYQPPLATRFAERLFPQWGRANRQAAMQSHVFDAASVTSGFQQALREFAASYDVLRGDRNRKGYVSTLRGRGDDHLDEATLSRLREIARDASRNDPVVRGMLETYAEGIVGTDLPIEARTKDEKWNEARESLWRERMVDQPCDATGRFNFPHSIFLAILQHATDGDFFVAFDEDKPWLIEGEQCGSPIGVKNGQTFVVTNGVATALPRGQVIGYYIGTPNKWGYIEPNGYQKFDAADVHHVFDPTRISYTRGEPILTPSVQWFDNMMRYADAELVTSIGQACQGVAITRKEATDDGLPHRTTPQTQGGYTVEDKLPTRKFEPFMVWNLEDGEDVRNIGVSRPSTVFGEFMNKVLMIAGRAAGMPLMLITQDLSGATFMNARIANQMAQERWRKVQSYVVKPLASRWYLWQTERDIASGELAPAPEDWRKHEVFCRRWPYVDPEKEAKADEIELRNGTTSRTFICSRSGRDIRNVIRERIADEKIEIEEREAAGLPPKPTSGSKSGEPAEDQAGNDEGEKTEDGKDTSDE